METVDVRTAGWFRALYLGSAVLLVGGAIAAFVTAGDLTTRWMTLVVLGGSGGLCAWLALSRRRGLTLDHQGIHGRPFGVVLWTDIQQAFVLPNNLNRVLGLNVREPSVYLERLPRWRRSLWSLSQRAGFGDVSFDITGMDIDSEEIVRLIRERAGCQPPEREAGSSRQRVDS
jgi:hypothetical protein